MTGRAKLEKIKELADAMYYAAMYLTTDASRLHKAMDEYHQFIIHECKEEPVSGNIDFEKELYKAFGQVKDFALGMQIAEWFYDIGRKHNEPVSEKLEEVAEKYAKENTLLEDKWVEDLTGKYDSICDEYRAVNCEAFIAGAEWQKAQMIKDSTNVTVHIDAGGYPYIPQIELYDYDKDVPLAKEGDKYKVILIKED